MSDHIWEGDGSLFTTVTGSCRSGQVSPRGENAVSTDVDSGDPEARPEGQDEHKSDELPVRNDETTTSETEPTSNIASGASPEQDAQDLRSQEADLLSRLEKISNQIRDEHDMENKSREARDTMRNIIEDCDISIHVHESRLERDANSERDEYWKEGGPERIVLGKLKDMRGKQRKQHKKKQQASEKRLIKIQKLEEKKANVMEAIEVVKKDLAKLFEEAQLLE
ncbi:hypothetical protein ACHAPU_007229 [Fusarium lateritium]